MRVLLLHPEDELPRGPQAWDLIVDLGRAPAATYERWSANSGGQVISLYDFGCDMNDLYHLRRLLTAGTGAIVDDHGIDWWEVLSPMLLPDLLQALMLYRLADRLGAHAQLHVSRPDGRALALHALLGGPALSVESRRRASQRFKHYAHAFSKLDFRQIAQVLQDKFDEQHSWRRRFASRRPPGKTPVFLLPSAYVNVSRAAVSYAALVPEQRFLLVLARRTGRLNILPENVEAVSLDGYFITGNEKENRSSLAKWSELHKRLVAESPEFFLVEKSGILQRFPSFLKWGIAVRNAWQQVFSRENVAGCLCADDTNPYSGIPLLLAKKQGLPALACHHGAMDYRTAAREPGGSAYLVKTAMEYDYLVRECKAAPQHLAAGGRVEDKPVALPPPDKRPWLVFFTEPYDAAGWRTREIYRELLPRLWSLSQECGLELVFKLHPFESVGGHRKLLGKYLLPEQVKQIGIIAGAIEPGLWQKTRLAMTVQSTIAVEAAQLGIPVFLCGWLRNSHGGYVQQFSRFGVGQVLESAEQMAEVPGRLAAFDASKGLMIERWTVTPAVLRSLLRGARPAPVANVS